MNQVKNYLSAMLAIQGELNKKVHPLWEKQNYPYPDAMFTEATEAYNHLNWEWWKSLGREIDWNQVKMEVVDIGHFLFSEVINNQLDPLYYTAQEDVEKDYNLHTIVTPKEVKKALKHFITATLLYDEGSETAEEMLYSFFYILKTLNLTLADYYKLYVGKVCLNELRWANGYKKGIYVGNGYYDKNHYVKIWDKKEDNEWLSEKIETMNIDSPTFKADLSAALVEKYNQVRNELIDRSMCQGAS